MRARPALPEVLNTKQRTRAGSSLAWIDEPVMTRMRWMVVSHSIGVYAECVMIRSMEWQREQRERAR